MSGGAGRFGPRGEVTETFRQLPEGEGALEQAMRFKKTQAATYDLLDELEADRRIGGNLGIEG